MEIINIKDDYIDWLEEMNKKSTKPSLVYNYILNNHFRFNIGIKKLCKGLGVSYERYRKRKLRGANVEPKYNPEWLKVIQQAYDDNFGNFGRPRLLFVLKRDYGLDINDNTLYRYMCKLGLKSQIRKWKNIKKPKEYKYKHNVFPNIIGGKFKTKEPNMKWYMDESYIDLPRGEFAYLCTIVDSYNNEIVASRVSDYRDQWLVFDTLKDAIKNRDTKNTIIHTDRTYVYFSKTFREMCKENNITQSMNDVVSPTLNRPVEFLFYIFKSEYLRLLPTKERNLNVLEKFVFNFVEHYNYIRFQPCLGWKTPKEFGQ